jgi:hypothetical protein
LDNIHATATETEDLLPHPHDSLCIYFSPSVLHFSQTIVCNGSSLSIGWIFGSLIPLPQIPICTPTKVLERLHSFYTDKNIDKFRTELDSLPSDTDPRCFDIHDLDMIMVDAIRRDDPQFSIELLHRGLHLHPDYLLEAAKSKARNILEMFLNEGLNINKPLSEGHPPMLKWTALECAEMLNRKEDVKAL